MLLLKDDGISYSLHLFSICFNSHLCKIAQIITMF